MNFTLRVDTGERTFIIKQSRGYVEKFPEVTAPSDRALREAEFYELIDGKPSLRALMPKITGVDVGNFVLVMEDLGKGKDYTFLYRKGEELSDEEMLKLVDFAAELHKYSGATASQMIRNHHMRRLNHEHIFQYPYIADNGLDLDDILPGLQEASKKYKADEELKRKVKEIGKVYLSDEGENLLHGDYFPGSWLKTDKGIKIIDPEFCFFGPPEFEIGVMIAHLKLADQPRELIDKALQRYTAQADLDDKLRQKFTATEVLRRILGLAQLPLEIDLEQRKQLMQEAAETLKTS